MSILFNKNEKKTRQASRKPRSDLIAIESVEHVLAGKKRQALLAEIKGAMGLDEAKYSKLALTLIGHAIQYYQNLPEATPYFGHQGGLLDRALNRAEAALQLLRGILVLDDKKTPSPQQKLWLYALFSAAMLQGVGKLYTDYRLDLYDSNAQLLKCWQPLLEDLASSGQYYHYDFLKGDDAEFRNSVTPLLARTIMPKAGFSWIMSNTDVFTVWLALLMEDHERAGPLAAILERANAIATQRDIQEYLARYKEFDARGNRLSTFSEVPLENQINRERIMGAEFFAWLMQGLETGKILINKHPLLVQISSAVISLHPQLFEMFALEHHKFKNKEAVKQAFLSWKLHAVNDKIKSNLRNQEKNLAEAIQINSAILPEKVKVYHENTHKISTMQSIDVVSQLQGHLFNPNQPGATLSHLSPTGQWVAAEEHAVAAMRPHHRQ